MRRPYSRTLPPGRWDAVVVGSGIGGLACAALLALKGLRVLVLEQHHTPGGLIQTFVRGRFRFDTGLHVLGELHPDGLPARLLVPLTGGARFRRLGPVVDRIHHPDGVVDLRAGRDALVAGLEERFPGCEESVRATLDRMARASAHVGTALLARNLPPQLRDLMDRHALADGERLLRTPAAPWLGETLGDGLHADALAIRAGYHGTPLHEASAGAHAAVCHHYVDGAWAPAGDARDITHGLAATVARAGGWTVVGADVVRIDQEAGAAVGVVLRDGQTVRAPCVVSAVGVHNTLALLDAPPEPWAAALRALHPSPPHVGLYLGLSTDPGPLGATAASHWALSPTPGIPGIYLRFPTVGRPGPHRATLTAAVPEGTFEHAGEHGARAADYSARKADLQESLLAAAEAVFPGLRGLVVHAELSTPQTTHHFTRSHAMYGLAATVPRFACDALRAHTPVPGLVLAGVDVGMSGVVGGLMSGVHAAITVHPRAFSVLARARFA